MYHIPNSGARGILHHKGKGLVVGQPSVQGERDTSPALVAPGKSRVCAFQHHQDGSSEGQTQKQY